MEFQDKTLACRDCGGSFVFTAGEQGFYLEKGLMNEPQRCGACRAIRRRERANSHSRDTAVVCAACGRQTTVPFIPRLERPVFCSDCFAGRKEEAAVGA